MNILKLVEENAFLSYQEYLDYLIKLKNEGEFFIIKKVLNNNREKLILEFEEIERAMDCLFKRKLVGFLRRKIPKTEELQIFFKDHNKDFSNIELDIPNLKNLEKEADEIDNGSNEKNTKLITYKDQQISNENNKKKRIEIDDQINLIMTNFMIKVNNSLKNYNLNHETNLKLDHPEQSLTFLIYNYKTFSTIQEGNFFGDSALDRNTNRNATIVAGNQEVHLGVISKEFYNEHILFEKKKINAIKVDFIYSCIFNKFINKIYFEKKYFSNFIYEEYYKDHVLIKENENLEYVYFINEGGVEMNMKKNYFEIEEQINNLFDKDEELINEVYIDNDILNLCKQFDPMKPENKKIKDQLIILKRNITLKKITKNDILGVEHFLYDFPSFYTAIVNTKKLSVYKIECKTLRTLINAEAKGEENFKRFSNKKIASLISRLYEVKNSMLDILKLKNYSSDKKLINFSRPSSKAVFNITDKNKNINNKPNYNELTKKNNNNIIFNNNFPNKVNLKSINYENKKKNNVINIENNTQNYYKISGTNEVNINERIGLKKDSPNSTEKKNKIISTNNLSKVNIHENVAFFKKLEKKLKSDKKDNNNDKNIINWNNSNCNSFYSSRELMNLTTNTYLNPINNENKNYENYFKNNEFSLSLNNREIKNSLQINKTDNFSKMKEIINKHNSEDKFSVSERENELIQLETKFNKAESILEIDSSNCSFSDKSLQENTNSVLNSNQDKFKIKKNCRIKDNKSEMQSIIDGFEEKRMTKKALLNIEKLMSNDNYSDYKNERTALKNKNKNIIVKNVNILANENTINKDMKKLASQQRKIILERFASVDHKKPSKINRNSPNINIEAECKIYENLKFFEEKLPFLNNKDFEEQNQTNINQLEKLCNFSNSPNHKVSTGTSYDKFFPKEKKYNFDNLPKININSNNINKEFNQKLIYNNATDFSEFLKKYNFDDNRNGEMNINHIDILNSNNYYEVTNIDNLNKTNSDFNFLSGRNKNNEIIKNKQYMENFDESKIIKNNNVINNSEAKRNAFSSNKNFYPKNNLALNNLFCKSTKLQLEKKKLQHFVKKNLSEDKKPKSNLSLVNLYNSDTLKFNFLEKFKDTMLYEKLKKNFSNLVSDDSNKRIYSENSRNAKFNENLFEKIPIEENEYFNSINDNENKLYKKFTENVSNKNFKFSNYVNSNFSFNRNPIKK